MVPMPARAHKGCAAQDSTALVYDGGNRCPSHARPSWQGPRTASSKRTGTRRWKALRERVLTRDHRQCRIRLDGCIGAASEVHHLVEVAAGGGDELSGLVSVCIPCH